MIEMSWLNSENQNYFLDQKQKLTDFIVHNVLTVYYLSCFYYF